VVTNISEECIMSTFGAEDEGTCSSAMLITTYKITWHCNPEDHNPYFHHYENLKSYID
jgi:hypothetical protein